MEITGEALDLLLIIANEQDLEEDEEE